MTGFDLAIVGIVALSALLGFFRGIVRSLIGLAAWVAGFVAGIAFAPWVATLFPVFPDYPLLPYAIAFVLIFLLSIVAGALIAWPLHVVIHKAGLGFVDRGLGFVFGIARGLLVILLFVLVGGLSPLPERASPAGSLRLSLAAANTAAEHKPSPPSAHPPLRRAP